MPIIRLPEPTSGSSSNTTTPPSRSPGPSEAIASGSSTVQNSISQNDRRFSDDQTNTGMYTPQLMSGANTPHTSNPPQIFASAGSTPPNEDDNDGMSKDEEDPERLNLEDARKAAAEAALRRMTLRSGSTPKTTSFNLGPTEPESTTILSPVPEILPESPSIPPPQPSTTDRKGKRKADPLDQIDERPRVTPYLTLPGSDLLSLPDLPTRLSSTRLAERFKSGSSGEGGRRIPRTIEETRGALEDRLRVLQEVDEVVWGLVGELSRVKSGWEREDMGDDHVPDPRES